MKTIDTIYTRIDYEKKSKFITILIPIRRIEEVTMNLEHYKVTYPKANHYCYAYIVNQDKGMSDDKEPAKTAGAPLLNILEKEQLTNILVIVIRYFGGIKLGTGGLIRAYSHGIQELLKTCPLQTLIPGLLVTIRFPFSLEKKVIYLLHNSKIISKQYKTDCLYTVEISEELFDRIQSIVTVQSIQKILIEKTD